MALSNVPEPFYRGKVRDLYPVNDNSMIIVASDRLSAFDVIFPEEIPGKGELLTEISVQWFNALRRSGFLQSHNLHDHLIEHEITRFPAPYTGHTPFRGRAMHVRRVKRIDFECVVRGYLAGSAYKEYRETGSVCGHRLPEGLKQASRLPAPIFTPATKAPDGEHDINISVDEMRTRLGTELTDRLASLSIAIFTFASNLMAEQGILLCDTKFEFGLDGDEIVLIDEVLTPDSSRYWDAESYIEGTSPAGFDKQHIRDYVESIGWNKKAPAPSLPSDVREKTVLLYQEIQKRIHRALHF